MISWCAISADEIHKNSVGERATHAGHHTVHHLMWPPRLLVQGAALVAFCSTVFGYVYVFSPSADTSYSKGPAEMTALGLIGLILAVLLVLFFGGLGLAWLVLNIYARRYQLQDLTLGCSDYALLPIKYKAEVIGVIHHEGEAGMTDDHGHDHEHGPHDQEVVAQRWAVVTGASAGLGSAFVRVLADQGFSILCADADSPELDAVVARTNARLERGWRGGVWPRTEEAPTAVKLDCDVLARDFSDRSYVREAVNRANDAVSALPPGSLRLCVLAANLRKGEDWNEIFSSKRTLYHLSMRLNLRPFVTTEGVSALGMLLVAPSHTSVRERHALCELAGRLRWQGPTHDVFTVVPRSEAKDDAIARASLLLLPTAGPLWQRPNRFFSQAFILEPLVSDALVLFAQKLGWGWAVS